MKEVKPLINPPAKPFFQSLRRHNVALIAFSFLVICEEYKK